MIALFLFLMLVVLLGVIVLLAAALFWTAGARVAEPPAAPDAVDDDEWMAVADAVAEPDGDFYDTDEPVCLDGFTELETQTFRRNYLPLTDPERLQLDAAFRSIVEGADR